MTRPLGIPRLLLPILILAGGTSIVSQSPRKLQAKELDPQVASPRDPAAPLEKATLGGGCFWCTEAFYRELAGVRDVVSGYSGGQKENPTYEAVCTGLTGHAEVIQVTYDPGEISYEQLLEVFWKTHDPTTLNRQGVDVGTQYRSVLFYANENQHRLAEETKKKLDHSGAFTRPIATEISPLINFYPAEDYHQDYYRRHGRQPYCKKVIRPKMNKFRKVFADRLKQDPPTADRPNTAPSSTATSPAPIKTSAAQDPIDWTRVDWRKRLTRMQYRVTRKQGTEQAFTGKYWDNRRPGIYECVCCGLPLFNAATKFKSGTGWPSY